MTDVMSETKITTSPEAEERRPLDLIPARMLNEFAYCPRLAYLEWVQGEFAPSADTLDGSAHHRRVDKPSGYVPPPATQQGQADGPAEGDTQSETIHACSVHVSAPRLGMTAVIDLLESRPDTPDGAPAEVSPVDYKRGAVPDLPERAWEADRVQLCAQGMILRENGYRCDGGVIYYIRSKTRVDVDFDDALCRRVRELLAEMRTMARAGTIPPPLEDSPKCPRCSLVGICLPDETRLLSARELPATVAEAVTEREASAPAERCVRRLIPTRDDARPLYVQESGAYVGKKGDALQVRLRGDGNETLGSIRLAELSHVSLFGNAQVSTQAVAELCDRQIPVAYFTTGGYFRGLTLGLPSKNVDLRLRQYAAAEEPARRLSLARAWVAGKIANQRTLLRRNHPAPPEFALKDLRAGIDAAHAAESIPTLLGIEGNAAKTYFGAFAGVLKPRDETNADGVCGFDFDFRRRNRRPPVDPVNALLSYGYAILAKDLTVACWIVGFDPFLGFFHQPKYGKPALALDLMEEFRPIVVDSVVITAINTGVVVLGDFVSRGPAVALRPQGRRRFLQAYERRMNSLVTHPVFGYRISYRRVLEVQVRLLARVLLGELPEYVPFVTR